MGYRKPFYNSSKWPIQRHICTKEVTPHKPIPSDNSLGSTFSSGCTALRKPISIAYLVTELSLLNIRFTFQAFHEPISSLNRLSMALKRKSRVEWSATRNLQDLADKGIVVSAGGGRSIHYKINL